MSDLLNGIGSAVGELLTVVQTLVVATQTLAITQSAVDGSSAQTTSATVAVPTTTTTATPTTTSSTIQSTDQSPTTTSQPTTQSPTLRATTSAPQPVVTTTKLTTSIATTSAADKALGSSTLPITSSHLVLSSSTSGNTALQLATSSSAPAAAASSVDVTTGAATTVDHKPAIIGGVIGAIVGIVLLGFVVLLCCLHRRRRRRRSTLISEQFHYEPRPAPYRLPTGMSEIEFGYAAPLVRPSPVTMRSFKSANGTLIHMSLDHFTRPFGEQEGYRDTVPFGSLHVTNPDRSLPVTPNLASHRLSDPFNRARTLHSSPMASEKGGSVVESSALTKLPLVHIDEVSPIYEDGPTQGSQHYAPSFRSYPSLSNSSPRNSRWFDDDRPAVPRVPAVLVSEHQLPKRPTLSPLHSAASRTLSSIGNALRLSSGKTGAKTMLTPEMAYDVPGAASRHVSGSSDPFDLDSPTRRSAAQHWQRLSAGPSPRHFTTYEGT